MPARLHPLPLLVLAFPLAGCAAARPAPAAPTPAPRFDALRAAGRASDSAALLVWEDGRLRVEDYDAQGPRPVSIQSITKSVVSLAIGRLVAEGRIGSIDDPVARYLPELAYGGRERITLRHVLTHRSGLEAGDQFGLEVEEAYSMLASAVAQPMSANPPGHAIAYDNRGWQLLCGVIHRVTGEDVQDYMRHAIFAPMGITDFTWARDPSGATVCHAALALRPRDLGKIGQLLLDRGRYQGREIVPASWFELALPRRSRRDFTDQSGIWWEGMLADEAHGRVTIERAGLDAIRAHGLWPATADALAATDGGTVAGFWDAYLALAPEAQANFRDARLAAMRDGMPRAPILFDTTLTGVYATGGGGQYLRVDLAQRRVIVRLIEADAIDGRRTSMPDFQRLTAALPAGAD